jgi:hypothetical protein
MNVPRNPGILVAGYMLSVTPLVPGHVTIDGRRRMDSTGTRIRSVGKKPERTVLHGKISGDTAVTMCTQFPHRSRANNLPGKLSRVIGVEGKINLHSKVSTSATLPAHEAQIGISDTSSPMSPRSFSIELFRSLYAIHAQ